MGVDINSDYDVDKGASPDLSSAAAPVIALLRWYDANARDLPWRMPPARSLMGERANPYHVWLAEIMLQQTVVATVIPYYQKFLSSWPDIEALASADEAEILAAWAGLGYYARARNLIRCARVIVDQHQGRFPDSEDALRSLPGIGDYSATAIAAIAFGRSSAVIDGNIERILTRLWAVDAPMPAGRKALRKRLAILVPDERPGDFAQALMDLGASICRPRDPDCARCPLAQYCQARKTGRQEAFPNKAKAKPKAERRGEAWVVMRDRHILLVKRPDKGLLGGMMALPDNGWNARRDGHRRRPLHEPWRVLPDPVHHIFTHISLRLDIAIYQGDAENSIAIGNAMQDEQSGYVMARWWPLEDIGNAGLPGLYKKVIDRLVHDHVQPG